MIILSMLNFSCQKDNAPTLPEDVSLAYPENEEIGVSLNANLVWEAVNNSDKITYDIYLGYDAFSLTLISENVVNTSFSIELASESKYFWKVVAKDNKGRTIKSPIRNFTTEMIHWNDNSSGIFIDPRDNHKYKVIKFGEQTWFAENLAFLASVSSPDLGSVSSPFYYVYGYSGTNISEAKATDNYLTYGVLYNVVAAQISSPVGWHLPSDEEWTTFTNYLTNKGYGYNGSGDQIAKSIAANSGWFVDNGVDTAGSNQESNNSTGFTARPGGCRTWEKDFFQIGKTGYWWSSTPIPSSDGYYGRTLNYEYSNLDRQGSLMDSGISIRCLLN
ncbi:fibrobacter succinogenes major paralogous domain-containing protein [uncultured Draconibacterium sp.]|uniref:fibrobacter succinogenes major paralogous domain-containing protein n=1 Tax=uncultured Draconibacterium sp. TaxID=1573823 RepID=UPI0029C6B8FD|nr:fibrobacter succinogenes major paralogous domain-containing protein [uncultured Draconibacterium sp.]